MTQAQPRVTIRGEFCIETRPEPCGLIIFGASGDLTGRKLVPSMFSLYRRGLLSKQFYLLGQGRTEMDDQVFRNKMRDELMRHVNDIDNDQLNEFLKTLYYHHGDYSEAETYAQLADRLHKLDEQYRTGGSHLFYLALPPSRYAQVVHHIGDAGLAHEEDNGPWVRVVLEKPFGHDLRSALDLDRGIHEVLTEKQIYRIDHYLGKETVQNILMFRFANAIFEPIWNRRYVDHVQITVAESLGIGHRAGYFEQAGVIRDMFQNHMLQMLALVAMEPPASFEADRVRDERVKLLRSIRPFDVNGLDGVFVRGQYAAGRRDGEQVNAYRDEQGVAEDSMVETYLAARLMVDNWRWQGVPFYMRSGKQLARRVSEIAITFKQVPHSMFTPIKPEELVPNVLVLNVQPDEGVSMTFQAKHPGPKLCMSSLTMDFSYREVFQEAPPESYERLLLDCMLGDQTLFVRHDDMTVAWALITPVLEHWAEQGTEGTIHPYAPGSWGPDAADGLLARSGVRWRRP